MEKPVARSCLLLWEDAAQLTAHSVTRSQIRRRTWTRLPTRVRDDLFRKQLPQQNLVACLLLLLLLLLCNNSFNLRSPVPAVMRSCAASFGR